jgi:hypothetical protein
MKNHYHLIIETKNANLSKAMHYINASYTTYFNIKRKRTGPLYQGRYKAILIQADEYLHYLSSYIHLNPVRAHIVEDPINYPHSSYKYFVTNNKPSTWLNINSILSFFNKSPTKARQLYKEFVLSNIGREKEIITKNTVHGILLGNKDYLQWIQDNFIEKRKEDKEIPLLKKLAQKPKAKDIQDYIAAKVKAKKQIKRFSVYFIRKYSDLNLRQIAGMFDNLGYTGVSKIYKRTEEKLKTDKALRNRLAELEKGIMSKVKT